mgnify:FL=1
MNETQRNLKISSQARQNGKNIYKSWVNVPKLTLAGNWFEKAGFSIGDYVKILVTDSMVQIIKSKPPQAEEPQQVAPCEPLNDFVNYIDGLHYEGYSANIKRDYPDQWDELFRLYREDYPLLMQEPETEYVPSPIQIKRRVLSELSATLMPLVEAGEYANVNEGLIDMYKNEKHQEFKTYNQWKNEGFNVRKGEKAFNIWAKPLEAQKPEENATPEDESSRKFFPLCFLFSNAQVTKI